MFSDFPSFLTFYTSLNQSQVWNFNLSALYVQVIESKKCFFFSFQLTHNNTVDNTSRVRDLFVDRTQDCSQSGRTIWCSRLVQNMYSRHKDGSIPNVRRSVSLYCVWYESLLSFVSFWVNWWKRKDLAKLTMYKN